MKDTPRFTEGPWLREENTVCKLMHSGWKGGVERFRNRFSVWMANDLECPEEEAEAIAHLIVSSSLLYMALWAREVASEMQKDLVIPNPDDPRYTPFIGPWDGYKAPEIRFCHFQLKHKELRTEALKQARGEV